MQLSNLASGLPIVYCDITMGFSWIRRSESALVCSRRSSARRGMGDQFVNPQSSGVVKNGYLWSTCELGVLYSVA